MDENIIEEANELLETYFGRTLNDDGKTYIASLVNEYGKDEVIASLKIVCESYDDATSAMCKLAGTLYNRRKYGGRYLRK